jgi:alpha-N-arabinofuranosidase
LLEDRYNVADAVVVGNLLIALLRHSDRVRSASLAQLVNVIAPIMTEPGGRVWKRTTFHPFAPTSQHATGDVLQVALTSPAAPTAQLGDAPLVDATATYDQAVGAVTIFAVNRSLTGPVEVRVDLRAFGPVDVVEALTLAGPDPYATSCVDDDTTLVPVPNESVVSSPGQVTMTLPAVSWSMVRLHTVGVPS